MSAPAVLLCLAVMAGAVHIDPDHPRGTAQDRAGRPVAAADARSGPGARPAPQRASWGIVGGLRGTATWYRWRPGEAAAGPALRAALGPGWRGRTVRVCGTSACIRAVLSDWCLCGAGRVIDLDVRSFAALAPPSRGVLAVEVSW